MKHTLTVTAELIGSAIQSYLKSFGHTSITTSSVDGELVYTTEHAARRSFGDPIPATCKWPHDCFIQCGDNGVVLVWDKGNYTTAFWEAFPRNLGTFLRGEGSTIEEAEKDCFAQYERILACPGHEFERRKYESGAGICKHCNLLQSKVFEPTEAWKEKEAASLARIKASLEIQDKE